MQSFKSFIYSIQSIALWVNRYKRIVMKRLCRRPILPSLRSSFLLFSVLVSFSTALESTLSKRLKPLICQRRGVSTMNSSNPFKESLEGTVKPIRIGLTGSIGMGKSTITKQFRRLGFPVFDADEAVHQLYSKGGLAVEPIKEKYPTAIIENAVSRAELTKLIMLDNNVLPTIEKIVHPLVIAQRQQFTDSCTEKEELLVVYDIPLLFEKMAEYKHLIDYIVVVSCDAKTQEERVMRRAGMTKEKFQSILSKQVSDETKRTQADYIIYSNHEGYAEGKAQLADVLNNILTVRETERFSVWRSRASVVDKRIMTRDSEIRNLFDAIIFDLDETLCPIKQPIRNALISLVSTMEKSMPRTYQRFFDQSVSSMSFSTIASSSFSEALKKEMTRVKDQCPLVQHDLTELRRRALLRVARDAGEEGGVDQCMQAFLAARSNINPHLYEDTIPCLKFLESQGVVTSILTNGNCDFHLTAELPLIADKNLEDISRYLHNSLSASDVGCSKPHVVAFIAARQQLGNMLPSRILYVGDDYEKDVVGAQNAGMKTAFLIRDRARYEAIIADENHQFHPSHSQRNKIEFLLNNLQPTHLIDRIMNQR